MIRVIVAIMVAGGVLIWVYWASQVESGIEQPIQFPHKTHVGLGLPCATCHQRVERDAVAGRPPTVLCYGCHAGGETHSQEIKKLRSFGEKGQEIPWRRVWRLPSHVFFPHRVHVVKAKVKCQTCHGPMETLARPPATALRKLTMDDCMNCHNEKWRLSNARKEKGDHAVGWGQKPLANDCITCHR